MWPYWAYAFKYDVTFHKNIMNKRITKEYQYHMFGLHGPMEL